MYVCIYSCMGVFVHVDRSGGYQKYIGILKEAQCLHLISALMCWQPWCNTRPHVRLLPIFLGMNAWMISKLNVALQSQASWVINGSFSNMLSRSVCTTRHWQTSGRQVQELDVCSFYVCIHVWEYLPNRQVLWVSEIGTEVSTVTFVSSQTHPIFFVGRYVT